MTSFRGKSGMPVLLAFTLAVGEGIMIVDREILSCGG